MSNEYMVPTGSIIKEYLDEQGMSQKECAQRMGVSEKHLSNLLNGKSRLTEEIAIKLEKIIHDVPASYWLNYETKYREYVKRNEVELIYNEKELKKLSKRFMFSNVFKGLGWDLKKQADEMLKLLRISSFDQFEKVYSNLTVDFMEDGGKIESIAIWLNLAREEVEIQNKDISDIEYNRDHLVKSLDKFKRLALNSDYERSINSARKLLNQLGIYLVFCEPVVNSKVRGALTTYKKHPAIYLSGRFKTHDHVWFALMHEIGHLILHYNPDQPIVTFEEEFTSKKEQEANDFAKNFFINNDDYQNFIKSSTLDENSIRQFAHSQGILPGIVVARLQHDKLIGFDKYNYMKNRK